MIDNSSIQNRLTKLITKVRGIDVHIAQRLQDLSDALDDPVQAKIWAETDLYQLIDPDALSERYQPAHERLAEVLEVIRNAAIFLPILFTWLGVAWAASAYHQLLSRCLTSCSDQVSQPFLYLWEQGFGSGNFPDILKLSSIGQIDAFLLGGIFLITLYISIVSGQSKRQLRTELINVLADTTYLLRGQSTLLVSPVHNLDNIAKKMVEMSNRTLGQFNDLKDFLKGVADQLQQQSQATHSAHNDLLRTIGGINTLINKLQGTGTSFQQAGEEVSNQLRSLVGPMTNMANHQYHTLGKINQAADSLQNTVEHLNSIKGGQELLTERISNTLEQQSDVIGQLDTVTSNLDNLDEQLDQFLKQLRAESEAQKEQAESIAEIGQSVKETLAYTGEEATQIRNVAWEMHDVVNLLTSLANSSGVDFTSLVESYTQAAQIIRQSAGNLENSANNLDRVTMIIFNAAQDLRNAAAEFKTAVRTQQS